MARPQAGSRMFIDELIEKLESERAYVREGRENGLLYKFKDLERGGAIIRGRDLSQNLEKWRELLLREAKVFWIDEMTADSLYNVPHPKINYEKAMYLPFPTIFFEFEKPFEIDTIDRKRNLKGMLYTQFDTLEAATAHVEDIVGFPGWMRIALFSKEDVGFNPGADIWFDVKRLPNFIYSVSTPISAPRMPSTFSVAGQRYACTTAGIYKIADSTMDMAENVKVDDTPESHAFPKLIDLAVNIVSYVNAQNVEIVKSGRGGSDKDLDKINRKRAVKGKNPIKPPKSYYWINIKKSYVSEDDEHEEGEKLKWRVWVRGHFRHYSEERETWIEPHVKGPRNAPWRHNRYAVSYAKYRDYLARRGDESL